VTIQFGTQQIVPKLTELSPGVYRVKVEVDGSVFERDESKAKEQAKSNTKSELQWQVRAKTGAFSIETPFSINAPALIEN
jgi:hypothetical protein